MFMRGPGFPDPLFEKIEELDEIAEKTTHSEAFCLPFYLLEAEIGPLRVADPILGDLTVMALEAMTKVQERIAELREPIANPGVPLE